MHFDFAAGGSLAGAPGSDVNHLLHFDFAAGGSRAPADLVGTLGFDIADRQFWQGGCDLIRRRVELAAELAVI